MDETSGDNAPAAVAAEAPVVDSPAPAPAADTGAGAKAAVSEMTEKASGKIRDFISNPSGNIVTFIIIGALITMVTAYGLYWMITNTVSSQKSYILAGTETPKLCTQVTTLKGSDIPLATNGTRFSMSFWIYINDITVGQGTRRHVFHRGTNSSSFASDTTGSSFIKEGPFVVLDQTSSELTITFPPITTKENTLGKVSSSDAKTTFEASTSEQQFEILRQHCGITFPYIPLQRWVHVALVINENTNGGIMTGYIDSEVAVSVGAGNTNTATSHAVTVTNGVEPKVNIGNANLNTNGNVIIGGSFSDLVGPGFSGLVSRISFFNYDMSASDVYTDYSNGPVNSMLSKVGLPAYGVQSPIYKIN